MPGGVHTHALSRSLRALSIGAIRAFDDTRNAAARDGLGELDHQFQAPISGVAGGVAAYAQLEVLFAAPLIEARDSRHPDFADPLFTYGAVVKRGPGVFVSCAVRRWLETDGYYEGAIVEVGVCRPGAMDSQRFAGEVHLNFQGFGAPSGDEDDGEDDEA